MLGRSLAIGDCLMIACACVSKNNGVLEPRESEPRKSEPHEVEFESLLPAIQRCAAYAFRRMRRSLREDLIAEAIANAYVAFARLIKRGLATLVYPTALAKFAVRQVWDGRIVGSRHSARDVLSEYAQAKRSFVVEWLDHKECSQPAAACCRRRLCLLKGCERPYQPTHSPPLTKTTHRAFPPGTPPSEASVLSRFTS
jgi:hypothetical protein